MPITSTARLGVIFKPDGEIALLLAPGLPFEQTLALLNLLSCHYPGRSVSVVTIEEWGQPQRSG